METNKNKDWRESWQKQLDDYSVTPPPQVWEKLNEELAPRMRVGRRAVLWAAAACIAVLVGTFVGLQYLSPGVPSHEVRLQTAHTSQPTVAPQPAADDKPALASTEQPLYAQTEHHTTPVADSDDSPEYAPTQVNIPTSKPSEAALVDEPTDSSEKVPSKDEAPKSVNPTKESQPHPTAPRTREREQRYSLSANETGTTTYPRRESSHRAQEGWTVGLSLGNSLITAADNRNGFGNLAPYSAADMASLPASAGSNPVNEKEASPYQHVMLQNLNAQPTTDVKHHFPVSVGITVQKSLNPVLALETGVVYTYLASDLTAGDATYYTQKQQLHYLGIPLKLNWNFLRKRYFNLYLAGGGMVEKCVYGELSARYDVAPQAALSQDETLSIDPLQWSVSAAVGITLKLAPHVNLYAEPGIVYYFDDGSQVSTIRKEKPFNINLQGGLRFDF